MDLDSVHTELQSSLKKVDNYKDLVPYIEKTIPLQELVDSISDNLEKQLIKEKKDDNNSSASILKPLYELITAPKPDKDSIDINDEKENKMMKPRKVEHDDDAKSHDGADDDDEEEEDTFRRPPRRQYFSAPEWSTSICYNCGEKGHFARECPLKRGGGGYRTSYNDNIRCYHCGKDGHFARDCPESNDDDLNNKCFRCGKMGHWARDCDQQQKQQQNRFSNDKCHRCGKVGHWARDCDKPYNANFKMNDKCNRCGKVGHWARDCDQPRNDQFDDHDY